MMGMHIAGLTLVISLAAQVFCSGMFEVSILAIYNYRGQKEDGSCCAGIHDNPPCTMECRTFFSICLLHYVTSVPENPDCIFGSHRTPVLGGNDINTTQLSRLNYFPLRLPLNFAWPGKFTLVVDVVNDKYHNGSTEKSQRILRTVVSRTLNPPSVWMKINSTNGIELYLEYRVVCDINFYGSNCLKICRQRNDSLGHYICDEEGNKVCLPGWEGELCQTALCLDGCNSTRGHCDAPFQCSCLSGWTGKTCEECLTHQHCVHGFCHQPMQCICKDGWTGTFCDVDTRFCLNNEPCLNGGACLFNYEKNYTCQCPDGYEGEHCEFIKCHGGYCLNHGVCEEDNMGAKCTCEPEYFGKRCEYMIESCDQINCRNGGKCDYGKSGAVCSCTGIYTGKYCESEIDFCDSYPCKNGARCLNAYEGYVCECPEGYIGQNCEKKLNPCSNVICLNGGTCKSSPNGYFAICACAEAYTGYRCEISVKPCHRINCQNGGKCVDLSPTDFYCNCPVGYKGTYCQEKDNLCERTTCLNGGVCKSYTNFTTCICDPHYAGEFCEVLLLRSDQTVTHPNTDRNLVLVNNALYLCQNLNVLYCIIFICILLIHDL